MALLVIWKLWIAGNAIDWWPWRAGSRAGECPVGSAARTLSTPRGTRYGRTNYSVDAHLAGPNEPNERRIGARIGAFLARKMAGGGRFAPIHRGPKGPPVVKLAHPTLPIAEIGARIGAELAHCAPASEAT